MPKKNKPDSKGFVYSTDPDFQFDEEQTINDTLPPAQQKLKVRMETKHRGGKAVTIIEGFIGKNEDLEDLGRKLKNYCGTGGSAKDGGIVIQGDQREKVLQWLIQKNYNAKKI